VACGVSAAALDRNERISRRGHPLALPPESLADVSASDAVVSLGVRHTVGASTAGRASFRPTVHPASAPPSSSVIAVDRYMKPL